MKATSDLWGSPNTAATNSSSFSGLPGGYHGSSGAFDYVGGGGYWWSSTEYSSSSAWGRNLGCSDGFVVVGSNSKQDGFSVRCLRD